MQARPRAHLCTTIVICNRVNRVTASDSPHPLNWQRAASDSALCCGSSPRLSSTGLPARLYLELNENPRRIKPALVPNPRPDTGFALALDPLSIHLKNFVATVPFYGRRLAPSNNPFVWQDARFRPPLLHVGISQTQRLNSHDSITLASSCCGFGSFVRHRYRLIKYR